MLESLLALSHEKPVLLFKHSSTCPTSAFARAQVERAMETVDLPLFVLIVQVSRSLSMEVATRFDIRHESPQAILFYRGMVVCHLSHGRVRTARILEAVEEAMAAPPALDP
jgi:bacillithiol system protein YtxJ